MPGRSKEIDSRKKKSNKRTRGKNEDEVEPKSGSLEEEYVVENILDKRIINGIPEYFIKWKDWPSDTNTWEPLSNLSGCEELLKEFESKFKGGNVQAGPSKGGPAKKEKIPSKRPKQNSSPPQEDSESDYEEPEEIPPEENFEVDVLEEVPTGKVPVEIVGVVPIDSLLTYLVQWENDVPNPKKTESNNFGLVKAAEFKLIHPELVIDFFQRHIVWKRDPNDPAEQARLVFEENKRSARAITYESEETAKDEVGFMLSTSSDEIEEGSDADMIGDNE